MGRAALVPAGVGSPVWRRSRLENPGGAHEWRALTQGSLCGFPPPPLFHKCQDVSLIYFVIYSLKVYFFYCFYPSFFIFKSKNKDTWFSLQFMSDSFLFSGKMNLELRSPLLWGAGSLVNRLRRQTWLMRPSPRLSAGFRLSCCSGNFCPCWCWRWGNAEHYMLQVFLWPGLESVCLSY